MRTVGRRAAIGATSLTLLLAAAGTSLAAVRASRDEGGVTASGAAFPAAGGGPATGAGGGTADGVGPPLPPLADDATGPGVVPPALPDAPGPAVAPDATAAPSTTPTTPPPAGRTAPSPEPPPVVLPRPTAAANPGTVPTIPPATGPTPTTLPSRPSPTVACPADSGVGALPQGVGALQAVDFVLPWPGLAPLYLVPQSSATRAAGATVRMMWSSVGGLSADGSSLTVGRPAALEYTLTAGGETDQGSVGFTGGVQPVTLARQACADRSFALYDVGRASLAGSPLRIAGVVALTGAVTLDGDGGTAHFTAGPGTHTVLLLTANDAGAPGPLVSVTVDVA